MQLHQPVLIQHTETGWIDGEQRSHISVVSSVSFQEDNIQYKAFCCVQSSWFNSIHDLQSAQNLSFTRIRMKKYMLAYSFSISYSLSGETVTWVSGRRLVGREQEPLIHPGSSIFGQG